MSVIFTVKTLAKFGEFYWSQYGYDYKVTFRKKASGKWKDALAEFLENYAFERQGKPPQFPIKAAEAVREYKCDIPENNFESEMWKKFCEKIGASATGNGANAKNNPLAPSSGNKKSIVSLIQSLSKNDYNIVRWAKEGIENGDISDIYYELQSVRGLGPKITAFFLRDVVSAFEIKENDLEPAKYLQPIDIWTRRGAEALSYANERHESLKNDTEFASIIVDASYKAGVSPSLVNAGIWIFGAKFAETKEEFREALENPDKLHRLLEKQSNVYKRKMDFLNELLRNS